MSEATCLRVGILPLARATFDVPYAQAMAEAAFSALTDAGYEIVGDRALLFDTQATRTAMAALATSTLDLLLIVQVTFTDATMTVEIARTAAAPLAIWAMPEPRAGGRLRLNSFCGLNLAMHALGRAGFVAGSLYVAPDDAEVGERLAELTAPAVAPAARANAVAPSPGERDAATRALAKLAGARIGIFGEHPDGFDTCRYDAAELLRQFGVSVAPFTLPALFERAAGISPDTVEATRATVGSRIEGLDGLDQPQLDRSLRVFDAMRSMATEAGCAALAVRCWPEMFTDYGCAACGPAGLLANEGMPCACEADVYGTLTSLLLQEIAGATPWLVDIVDMDARTDTGIFWHCGSAPLAMAGGSFPPRAQVHSNRRMPLLAEFTLRPGRITVARLSQARNEPKLVIAGAEIIDAPMAFTGTSATVRFDRPAEDVAAQIMANALEHHVAFVYGDHRGALRAAAAGLRLPLLELA